MMRKGISIILCLLLTLSLCAIAQAQGELTAAFNVSVPGLGTSMIRALLPLKDGGLLCGGVSYNTDAMFAADSDRQIGGAWVFRADDKGAVIWEKFLTDYPFSCLYAAIEAENGDYILVGESVDYAHNHDALNSQGDVTPAATKKPPVDLGTLELGDLDLAAFAYDYGSGASTTGQDTDATETMSGYAVRITQDGEVVWEKYFCNTGNVNMYAITKNPRGGYVIAGCREGASDAGDEIVTLRGFATCISDAGDTIWDTGSGVRADSIVTDCTLTNDGNLLLCGYFNTDIETDDDLLIQDAMSVIVSADNGSIITSDALPGPQKDAPSMDNLYCVRAFAGGYAYGGSSDDLGWIQLKKDGAVPINTNIDVADAAVIIMSGYATEDALYAAVFIQNKGDAAEDSYRSAVYTYDKDMNLVSQLDLEPTQLMITNIAAGDGCLWAVCDTDAAADGVAKIICIK